MSAIPLSATLAANEILIRKRQPGLAERQR